MSFVDMDVPGTGAALNKLASAGSTGFDAEWKRDSSTARSMAGGLGRGPMGKAFMEGYEPAEKRLTEAGARISQGLGQAVTAGRAAVADYQTADANAAAGLGR